MKSGIATPSTPLIQGHDAFLYGTGADGGLFRINKDGTGYSRFSTTNAIDFLEASDGVLYGTATEDGPGTSLVVFRLKEDGTDFGVLHTFGDTLLGPPGVKLTEGSDGMLYGTTEYGGMYTNEHHPLGAGTVFRLNKDGTSYSIIRHFGAFEADGVAPLGRLLQGSDGALYGTTWLGGSNYSGTVFKLTPDGTSYAILKHFDGGSQGGVPVQGMIEGSDGVLYGTTGDWYSPRNGTVFRLNKDGTGFKVLLQTDWLPSALAEGPDGALYGVTQFGGKYS
ncbi:MAG: choice-of-anchor tandem repeat GloVer-containing protein, partial [Limisphaerales bacterium]